MKQVIFVAFIIIFASGTVQAQSMAAFARTIWYEVESRDEETATLFDAMIYRDLSRHNNLTLVNRKEDSFWRLFFFIHPVLNNADRKIGYNGSMIITAIWDANRSNNGDFIDFSTGSADPDGLVFLKNGFLGNALRNIEQVLGT